jgi:acetyl-CoA C-acetyltransferase
MSDPAVYITAACRTPIGSLNGALATVPAHELGATVIRGCLERARLAPDQVEECVLGQVLAAGAGMNPARQAARSAGLPDAAPAYGVNQVCGSGLRTVALAFQQLRSGESSVIVAGGQESMSRAPHVAQLRGTHKLGDLTLADTVMLDGLTDAFHGCAMGVTAEALAKRFAISRDEQDAWALRSQQRAALACTSGRFGGEIVPVSAFDGKAARRVDKDEHIRHDSTAQTIAKPRAAFAEGGSVTAANSSGINDGAAAVLLMTEAACKQHRAEPLGRIVAWASAGVEPMLMGLGPVPAVAMALKRAGWSQEDVDLWEINEAFAVQVLAVLRELRVDPERVNINGGAIALGHPIGASGARVLVTLLHGLQAQGKRRGVAALCIGGGMGIALCVER